MYLAQRALPPLPSVVKIQIAPYLLDAEEEPFLMAELVEADVLQVLDRDLQDIVHRSVALKVIKIFINKKTRTDRPYSIGAEEKIFFKNVKDFIFS